jgi:hypothetical protein
MGTTTEQRVPAKRCELAKKPQAFTRCGSPGSKIYVYEMYPAPVIRAKATLRPT